MILIPVFFFILMRVVLAGKTTHTLVMVGLIIFLCSRVWDWYQGVISKKRKRFIAKQASHRRARARARVQRKAQYHWPGNRSEAQSPT